MKRSAPQGAPPGDFSFHAGWMIDGSGAPARPNIRVTVAGGSIRAMEAIGPGASPAEPAADHDWRGFTVIPGLIDSHVHLARTGSPDERLRAWLREAPFEQVREVIRDNLRSHLLHGVTAVRDGGGARGFALRFARGTDDRPRLPVRIRAAGRAWHRAGRYGGLIGRPPAPGRSLAAAIREDEERPDQVKVVNSGLNSLTEFGKQTAPQFDPEDLAAAVAAAAARGCQVMVHANGVLPVRGAVAAGCRSVEHGFFMGSDTLARMAARGVTWVPTAVTMQAHAERFSAGGRDPDAARRTLDHQLEQLVVARRAGVTVALGTDSGSPGVHHGRAVIAEMNLLTQAGFPIEAVIRCATADAAPLVAGGDGRLAPGRPATFVVVPGAPADLPGSLLNVHAVFIDGLPSGLGGLPAGGRIFPSGAST